jgi:transcriptional regulator with XRE-family HTH domain
MDQTIKSPPELQREMGEAVRRLRVRQGLTQAEAASKAGVALRSYAALEGAGNSSLRTFVRALNAFQATDVIGKIAPQSEVSPLAILRNGDNVRRRVRHRGPAA